MEELFADFQGKGHIITPLIFTWSSFYLLKTRYL
jgi:hypothetical protein